MKLTKIARGVLLAAAANLALGISAQGADDGPLE
jgi:hypothetical protein